LNFLCLHALDHSGLSDPFRVLAAKLRDSFAAKAYSEAVEASKPVSREGFLAVMRTHLNRNERHGHFNVVIVILCARLLCIVPVLTDDPRIVTKQVHQLLLILNHITTGSSVLRYSRSVGVPRCYAVRPVLKPVHAAFKGVLCP
jgi:hypothetical protein